MNLKNIFRSLKKHKTSTLFSAFSLLISFLGVVVITQYVSFEKSYDNFHTQSEQIYRLETLMYDENITTVFGKVIREQIPEVKDLIYVDISEGEIAKVNTDDNQKNLIASLIYTDQNFFEHFSFKVLESENKDFLKAPNCIALTQSFANKLFGNSACIGKNILLNNQLYKVSAIIENFPENSSFQADAIPSLETFRQNEKHSYHKWSQWSYNIYLKTANNTDPNKIAKKISQLPDLTDALEGFMKEYEGKDFFVLTPLKEVHFAQSISYRSTNKMVLKVLSLLALLLALMGAVNYINFSTSQAFHRIKSVSVMQVLGASRFTAIRHIITESVVFSIALVLLAILIHWAIHPTIESLFKIKGLGFKNQYNNILWFILFAITFGIAAACYPALFITSTKIVNALKGKPNFQGKGTSFRNTLLTIQFVFTITLIISAFFIEKQLNYWRNYNIGINKEHVVYLRTSDPLQSSSEAFAQELLNNNNIVDYTYSQFIPGNVSMGWGRMVNGKRIQIKCWPVDKRFLNFYNIEITQGRAFQTETDADINNFIINEQAVQKFNWEQPLEYTMNGFNSEGKIIGVAKNIHFADLKTEVQPMQFWLNEDHNKVLMLRLKTSNYTQTFNFIKKTANKFDPKNTIEVQFLDEYLNKMYGKEIKTARFIEFTAIWCMLLAITGILGLVVFTTRSRIKEIGIRKVNGANVWELMQMLNKDFTLWVVVAFTLSCPLGYYLINLWLKQFAYKTTLSWWGFAVAGIIAFLIALLTVSWQTLKAARQNPVEALRYE